MPLDPHRPLGLVHLVADLDAFAGEDRLAEAVAPLLRAGLPSLQLRGRARTTEELVRAGRTIREEARRLGCVFVVNGDAQAARELEADAVHFPAAGPPPSDARWSLPAGMAVGASCHDAGELERARGADWVLVAPVFPTHSKPGAVGLGRGGLSRLLALAPAPVYALGGITAANFEVCLEAGCAGVAAIRGLRGEEGTRLLAAARRWTRG